MKLHPPLNEPADLVQLAPNRVTANGRTGRNCQAALIALFDLAQKMLLLFSLHISLLHSEKRAVFRGLRSEEISRTERQQGDQYEFTETLGNNRIISGFFPSTEGT